MDTPSIVVSDNTIAIGNTVAVYDDDILHYSIPNDRGCCGCKDIHNCVIFDDKQLFTCPLHHLKDTDANSRMCYIGSLEARIVALEAKILSMYDMLTTLNEMRTEGLIND